MNYLNTLLFGYYPYIALSAFLLGSLFRYRTDQSTWRSGSSQFLRKRQLRAGSNLFHAGILTLLAGHTIGLLTPPDIYHLLGLSTSAKQLLAVIVGGAAGTLCFAGLVILLWRRLTDARIRATSSRMDIAVLVLLLVQLVLGLMTIPVSLGHLDGAQMLLLSEWAQRIVTFRSGAADLVLGVHWLFKAHLLVGITLVAAFPFSRLVHVFSAPVGYAWRAYQIVRRRQ
ncbi:MAG: respiratory nitrate reductase subunit gamma [Candidatus Melainabacteria bacterium]|nr:respiratory nitrate reductase subunit gamma [Candidatus Melainabacteria bacterium]